MHCSWCVLDCGEAQCGYVIVLVGIEALDRYSVGTGVSHQYVGSGVISFLARKRWFWIPPLYAVTLLLVLAVTLNQGPGMSQLMYRAF
jgi:hypothetical protein